VPFIYQRTVQFQDTDAAGVVYFSNLLAMCHEAYEASLSAAGMDLRRFFSPVEEVYPITHAEVDFFRPLFCGDRLTIHLNPRQTQSSDFEVRYQIYLSDSPEKPVSEAMTWHIAVDSTTGSRKNLSQPIIHWLAQYGGDNQPVRGNGQPSNPLGKPD
jgi:1,4-dihydroxy-2-naphthoyl-CoA hydrolase